MGKIINSEELGNAIVEIEKLLDKFDLTEKYLLLSQLKHRLNNSVDKLRDSDKLAFAMKNIPFGKLVSKAMKAAEEGD